MPPRPSRSPRRRRIVGTLAAAAAVASLTAAPRSNAADAADAPNPKAAALLQAPGGEVLGNPKGDATIVEFFDYACPYCKAAEPRLEALLKADKGLRLVVKEFPILTPQSLVATKAALAARRQGRYARFHQALMSYKGPLEEAVIFSTAKDVGLDMARLRKDMASVDVADEIIANMNLARSLRVFATPAFIAQDRILTESSATLDFAKVAAASRAR